MSDRHPPRKEQARSLYINHLEIRRARFLEEERRQEAERSIKYRGTASIKLDVLHFPYKESREPDKKNVKRLRNLFRREGGCRRLDLRNHIPAVISQARLEAAIVLSPPMNNYRWVQYSPLSPHTRHLTKVT